ncbi:helicase-related protein [uncultured Bacteroides sp.]|uniref:DEAD/DEAH box helicase n=1 Tax=uncultured Bacteroides sp. TaxID=162156 RepID=UPI003426E642
MILTKSSLIDFCNSYFAHANGKKMIIFAVNVEHSQRIVQEYREAGISAEHLDTNTPKTQREQILRNFKEGRTRVLSNVDIVSEGFDVPDCEAVQLARPTKSLALYLQQVGRCMRPAPGKSEGIVLDNAALWTEHGLSQQNRKWTLEGKKKKKRRNSQYPMDVVYVEDGVIRQPAIPEEVEGMQLLEMTQEMDDLLLFERFLEAAWDKGDKPIRAFMQLKDKLLHQDRLFTAFHLSYIIKRVYDYPEAPKKGLWYYTAIENNIDYKLIKKAVETYAYT